MLCALGKSFHELKPKVRGLGVWVGCGGGWVRGGGGGKRSLIIYNQHIRELISARKTPRKHINKDRSHLRQLSPGMLKKRRYIHIYFFKLHQRYIPFLLRLFVLLLLLFLLFRGGGGGGGGGSFFFFFFCLFVCLFVCLSVVVGGGGGGGLVFW